MAEPLAAALAANHGQLTFGQYMALSNQYYYAHGDVIGRQGDFITAPEISQLFGEMLGIWVVQRWQHLGQPAQWQLIELGPGRGTLMADALRVILKFISSKTIQLYAVETSPALRAQQKSAWIQYQLSPQWVDNIDIIPAGISITLANEFLDALPIEQFKWNGTEWLQLFISSSSHRLRDLKLIWLPALRREDDKPAPKIGDIYEFPALRHTALEPLAAKLKQQPGAALFIDYGFTEHAFGDTLQAVKNHQPVELLTYPGTADLTSHVNFAALTDWAAAQGLQTATTISQGDLLHSLGIAERLKSLQAKADMRTNLELLNGYQRLTAPSQMGTLFKALAIQSPALANSIQ